MTAKNPSISVKDVLLACSLSASLLVLFFDQKLAHVASDRVAADVFFSVGATAVVATAISIAVMAVFTGTLFRRLAGRIAVLIFVCAFANYVLGLLIVGDVPREPSEFDKYFFSQAAITFMVDAVLATGIAYTGIIAGRESAGKQKAMILATSMALALVVIFAGLGE